MNVNSDAWFVQPEFHLARQLDLVLGSRITKDLKTGVDRTGYTTASPLAIPIFYEHSKPTFLAGLNYRPLNNVLTYAKFTTGYISGGFFATRSFAPETSKSYEVGVKADLLDQHLRTNLSAFDVKYNNLQFTNSGASVGLPAFSQVVINAGNAKAKGFEFESTAVPTKGLTLSFNVGYTDFKFTSVSPLLAFFGNYIPALRPKWTGNASIQYETPEVFDGAHLLMRVDTNYRSKQYLVATYPSQAILDRETVYSSWIVNGRVGLVDLDIARKKAQVALWGRNILNNKKIDNASIGTFVTAVTYERARTFGLDLSFDL